MALAGAVLLLLLVTCSSVGLLFLTRAAGRVEEVSIRMSLGASRGRLVRQFLTESLCGATVGAALGLGAAHVVLAFLVRGLDDALPPFVTPSIDGDALVVSAVCSVLAALIAGVAPAASAIAFVRTSGAGAPRTRHHLVVIQVAVACVLVVLAALLGRSLDRLLGVEIGFRTDRLLVMRVTAPSAQYQAPGAMTRFYENVFARLRVLPGVSDVAMVNKPPVEPGSLGDLTVEGQPRRTAPIVTYRRVLPGYFRTLAIPIIEGRDFNERDGTGEAVTIVSASAARRFWPAGRAVGSRIKVGPVDREPWMRIIGVAGDVRNGSLEGGFDLAAYEPHPQRPWNGMFVLARTSGEPSAMTEAVRRALREVEPQVLISSVSTMDERIAESVAPRRFHAVVVGAFASVTLVLVALAVYGVVGSWVASHTRDLGIRAAVGASASHLLRAVMVEGLRPTLTGLALGLCGGWMAASAARALLFEVDAHDPSIFAATVGVLLAVAIASSWLPARRAMRVEPSRALRSE
jgi:predicted permease